MFDRHHIHGAATVDRWPPAPIVLVASGKGGVGKSTMAVGLALGLAGAGMRVGLVDADTNAPDVPLMIGLSRPRAARSVTILATPGSTAARLEPVGWRGVQVASAGFLVGDGQALPLAGGLAEALLTRLIWATEWDAPGCLVLDLPPGTGPTTQFALGLDGAALLVVATPERVAHQDTGRLLDLAASAGRAVLGGIENMAYYTCAHCGEPGPVYPPADLDATIWPRVPRLATVPVLAMLDGEARLAAVVEALGPAVTAVREHLTH